MTMSKSSLTQVTVPASTSNYSQGRKGYKICKFTPHHMAGVLTAEQCGKIFQNPGRGASSNYGIGNDGKIACYVEEENRAWTSSNGTNDRQAITVEVSNSKTGGEWPISEAAWNSLVNLAVDVCRRYNFRLEYDGTPNGSLTCHKMFAATSCPGSYLEKRLPELAKVVNKILDGEDKEPEKPAAPSLKYKVGDIVTINGVYVASNSTTKLNPLRDTGAITRIVEGARNPYLLEKGSIGWTNDDCIVSKKVNEEAPAPAPKKKSVNELADEVIAGKWGVGAERKQRLEAEGYDYEAVQAEVNRRYGVTPQPAKPATKAINVGSRVRVKSTAHKYCTGQTIPSFVKGSTYTVAQVGTTKYPNGILLSGIMSWVNRSDVDVL